MRELVNVHVHVHVDGMRRASTVSCILSVPKMFNLFPDAFLARLGPKQLYRRSSAHKHSGKSSGVGSTPADGNGGRIFGTPRKRVLKMATASERSSFPSSLASAASAH